MLHTLSAGGGGEAIAFRSADSRIYRASGYITGRIFESFDPLSAGGSPIPLSGYVYEEVLSLVWSREAGVFFGTGLNAELFTVTPGGFVTRLGPIRRAAKGLAFLPP